MKKLPDNAVIVVCMPTGTSNVPGSNVFCWDCGLELTFSYITQGQIKRENNGKDIFTVCMKCAHKYVTEDSNFHAPDRKAINEMALFGVDAKDKINWVLEKAKKLILRGGVK